MVPRHFGTIRIRGEFQDQGKAILMIGNHFSWWDGFFAHYLNTQLLHRRFNVMMLEEQLEKRMFLNKIGAFSINKGSRSAIESLNFLKHLLTDRKNMVVYYPQGRFHSIYDHTIQFESGIRKILSGETVTTSQVFLYAAMVDYLAEKKPGLTFYIEEFQTDRDPRELENAYRHLYETAIQNQKASV
jgi:hypothetical protein